MLNCVQFKMGRKFRRLVEKTTKDLAMPVFRTCTIVCDTCAASVLGHLEGPDDIRHPEGWRFDTSNPGPAVVSCPACVSNEHVCVPTTPTPKIEIKLP